MRSRTLDQAGGRRVAAWLRAAGVVTLAPLALCALASLAEAQPAPKAKDPAKDTAKDTPKPPPPASASPSAAPSAPSAPPAASAAPSAPPVAPPAPKPGDAKVADAKDDDKDLERKKSEARVAFERGLKLYNENLLQAALAEFLASRELYATRAATKNAAVCLQSLGRFDESLEMFEALLREFPTLPPDDKTLAQKAITELRTRVGTIEIDDAEPGASVVVDGKSRADYPLVAPLRAGVGTHSVRVFKQGFEPFETQVEVAGGKTVRVSAKLKALEASGKLRVSEASGKALEVLVDGALVGITPWEGNVSVGEHVVVLRGDDDYGTQPTSAPVKQNETATLKLAAELLDAELAVQVTPANARVIVDAVPVGRGVFGGRFKSGTHTIEVLAEGFFNKKQTVSLDKGEKQVVKIDLQRDDDAARWKKPSKFVLDLSGNLPISPSFEGQVAGGCGATCSRTVGLGGMGLLHASYETGSGFGVGLAGGYLYAEQSFAGRTARLESFGRSPSNGTVDDSLRMQGALVGLTGHVHIGERFPALFRLGAGAFLGTVRDGRQGGTFATAGGAYTPPSLAESPTAAYFYVDPEVQVGYRVTERFEVSLAVQALLMIAMVQPKWGDTKEQAFNVPREGFTTYPRESLAGEFFVLIAPGLSARYAF